MLNSFWKWWNDSSYIRTLERDEDAYKLFRLPDKEVVVAKLSIPAGTKEWHCPPFERRVSGAYIESAQYKVGEHYFVCDSEAILESDRHDEVLPEEGFQEQMLTRQRKGLPPIRRPRIYCRRGEWIAVGGFGGGNISPGILLDDATEQVSDYKAYEERDRIRTDSFGNWEK